MTSSFSPGLSKITSNTNSLRPAPEVRDPNQPGEVCLQSIRDHIPRLQSFPEGSRPLEERVAHLQDCPSPKLCRFLGMLNFYGRFLPQAAATQAPLHDVLSGPRVKGSHPIAWTPEIHKAFQGTSHICISTPPHVLVMHKDRSNITPNLYEI
jgi:hypothetical protein